MRVISGNRRGTKLLGPKLDQDGIRPTDDRVKEAVFNIIQPIKENCIVVDLFACTGSIGIEFLSRGARKAYFSELRYENVQLIYKNLEKTKLLDNAVVLKGDFKKNLKKLGDHIDYVYIDPPYRSDLVEKSLTLMQDDELFSNSRFIVEMEGFVDFSKTHDYKLLFSREYGRKVISIYERIK